MTKVKLFIGFFAIWAACVGLFWIWPDKQAMGLSLVFIYAGIPLLCFAAALVMGLYNYFGGGKWIFLLVFGIMYMLYPFLTYDMSRAMAAGTSPHLNIMVGVYGMVISLGGMLIGWGMAKSKEKKDVTL